MMKVGKRARLSSPRYVHVVEHSVLCVWEIYALENVVFYIVVYGLYKPYISCIHNTCTEC